MTSHFFWNIFLTKIQKSEGNSTTGTSINDVPRFLAIFDLPTYLVLLYNVRFLGLSWIPLPTLISDVINGRSLLEVKLKRAIGKTSQVDSALIITKIYFVVNYWLLGMKFEIPRLSSNRKILT